MSEITGSSLIERKDFSKIPRNIEIPDLIEIQKLSYDHFLQMEAEPDRREDRGLQAALTSVFPIADYNNTAVLEFVNYSLGTPKYDVRDCAEQGMSYAAPLKIRVRLVVLDREDKSPNKKVLDVREQESVSFIARRARFSPTTKAGRTPAGRFCIRRASSPIAVPGWISSLISATSSMFGLTAGGRCRRRSC